MSLAELIAAPDCWARLLGRATIAGIACAIVGPFGSYPANGFFRRAFWIGLFWAGTMLLWPATSAAVAVGARHKVPPRFAGAVAALVGCVPLAALAAGYDALFWPLHASGMGALEMVWLHRLHRVARARRDPAAGGAGRGACRAVRAAPDSNKADAGALPEPLRAAALCLQMEDHHVRVHLPGGGSQLHLMPMRRAVAALDGRGMQVHRSWWVARDAVRAAEEDGCAVTLVLPAACACRWRATAWQGCGRRAGCVGSVAPPRLTFAFATGALWWRPSTSLGANGG